jgi:cardiolipin synthase
MNLELLRLLLLIQVSLNKKYDFPIDCTKHFVDTRRILGDSKTWRGALGACVVTSMCAWLMGYAPEIGLLIATFGLDILSLILVTIAFIIIELALSQTSYKWCIRKTPYKFLLEKDMNSNNKDIINIPNAISFLRILMAPVLFYFALTLQPYWFIGVLLFAEFTDVLDGFLARTLNQITQLGSHLDSWGDFVIYTTIAICAWILWPDIIQREVIFFLLIVLSFTVPVIVGFIKFQRFTSYHTWGVKIAVAITVVGYILLFTELSAWPFRLAAFVCLAAAIEEISITLIIKNEHVDVRSLMQAIKYNEEISGRKI